MSKHKFVLNKEKEKQDDTVFVVVYSYWNDRDFEDEDGFPVLEVDEDEDPFQIPEACAMKVTRGNRTQYYVVRGRYGRLYNPSGMYSEGRRQRQDRHAGKPEWTMQPTHKKVFDYYLRFLQSKNTAWLSNAEREI